MDPLAQLEQALGRMEKAPHEYVRHPDKRPGCAVCGETRKAGNHSRRGRNA